MRVAFTCNGERVETEARTDAPLLEVLRGLGLTGAKTGCEVGVCGLCTVLVDELPVSSCSTLTPCVEGRRVWTAEGLVRRDPRLVEAFVDAEAMQCGICTPGQVVAVFACRAAGVGDDPGALRAELAGNLCRCTGYQSILEAARAFLAEP